MVPCLITLEELGYTVTNKMSEGVELWIAEKEGDKYLAEDTCALLGLVKLVEVRGRNWRVSDEQIKDFFVRFYPDDSN